MFVNFFYVHILLYKNENFKKDIELWKDFEWRGMNSCFFLNKTNTSMKCFEHEQLLSLLLIGGVHPEGNDGGMLGS